MSAALRLAFFPVKVALTLTVGSWHLFWVLIFPVLGILGAHRLLGDTTAYNAIWLICMVWGFIGLYLWWQVFRAMWAVLFRSSTRRARRRRAR